MVCTVNLWTARAVPYSRCWWLPAFLDFRPHPSNVCLLLLFCVCQTSFCLPIIRTPGILFRVHLDDPGSWPYLKIFHLTTSQIRYQVKNKGPRDRVVAILGPSVSVLWEGRWNEEDRPQDEREAAGQAVLRGRITLSPTQGHTASVNESKGQSPGLPSLGAKFLPYSIPRLPLVLLGLPW